MTDAADLPFSLDTDAERRLALDPDWIAGIEWGMPRRGHPEGRVALHIAQVLGNLERLGLSPADAARLRLAAIAHDSFKHLVDRESPRTPPNEHGHIAAAHLAAVTGDARLLDLVALHDDGYRAWRASLAGRHDQAAERLAAVAAAMGPELPLYLAFAWADGATGDKDQAPIYWLAEQFSLPLPLPRARA
jgi:hypothetical protein